MKKVIVLMAWCLPLFLTAQEKGIQWTEGLSWDQVMAKAKAENKFIFLDLYATWCRPCHAMDKEVYPKEDVGNAVNERFIAVKVQMDRTNYDNEQVKSWYNDSKRIEANYAINSYPTFLFFYSDGKPMHRAVGYRKVEEFIALAEDAINPKKQYYSILENYKPGTIDTAELKGLARAMKNLGGNLAERMAIEYLNRIPYSQLSNKDNINLMTEFRTSVKMQEIALKYLSSIPGDRLSHEPNLTLIQFFNKVTSIKNLVLQYLSSLEDKKLGSNLVLLSVFNEDIEAGKLASRYINTLQFDKMFTKEIIGFVAAYTKTSMDKGFKLFYQNAERVNKVTGYKNFAQNSVLNIIINEEYNKFYEEAVKNSSDSIPWDVIAKKVKEKYGMYYSERCDIHVKSSLYGYFAEKKNKYWPEYISSYINEMEKYGWDSTGPSHKFIEANFINNFVYDAIFIHSTDEKEIETGLRWMEGVIRRNPTEANNIDTYANLLYKAGKKEEAIKWQEKAVQTAIAHKQDWVLSPIKENLNKMKRNKPTWTSEKSE